MFTFRHIWTKFSPSEAQVITGVDLANQRNWRRRGYLPKGQGGWTEFEAPDLAKMLVFQSLANRGIGPSSAQEDAYWASLGILYAALKWIDSIDDKTGENFWWKYKDIPGEAAGMICRKLSKVIPGGRFWVWWADGKSECLDDIRKAFNESSWSEKYGGAVVVLDLQALGSQLLDRAGRPLVTIEKHAIKARSKKNK